MKYNLLSILLILFVTCPAKGQVSVSELEPAAYFDFWVGKWEVSWKEAEGKTGSGINTIEKILDGKVIRENFQILEGKSAGFKGTSISVYQPRFERWKQAWADNNGGYFNFTGMIDGNKRIFQTRVFDLENGKKFTQRMVFYDITENTLTWDWESSDDGGETWKLNWRIYYSRMTD